MEAHMKRMALGVAVVAVAALAAACGGAEEGSSENGAGTPTPNPEGVTFAQVQAVFDEHCVTCHYGNELQRGNGDVRANLLEATTTCFTDGEVFEKPVLTPGDPENSTLWHKTANVDLSCGREMPANGLGGLIEEDPDGFAIVEAWILAGAPE